VLCLVPPVSKDALTHHLAVPKLYLRHGGIYEIPGMPFSYFPMNIELLYLIPLYFNNDIAPKLIHFGFALLTGWLIFSYLRTRCGLIYALFGALFFLSIPLIVKLSITVYVDLGLIFFTNAALLFLIRWRESDFKHKYLALAALFCGLAAGTKYNGLITLFLLSLFTPFIYLRGEKRADSLGAIKTGIVFFSLAFLICSPWFVKNFIWTGNPLYPLYDNWFNPNAAQKTSLGLFTYRALVYGEKWWEMALLPLRIFFQGQDGNPQFFDGKLNPFLLVLAALSFLRLGEDNERLRFEKKLLLAFSVFFFLFAFFSSSLRMRYISPIIPPLVILSVLGIKKAIGISERLKSLARKGLLFATVGSALAAILINAQYVIGQFKYVSPLGYLRGEVSRDQYIERYRPEYPVMQYINKKLPANAKILFVFMGNRGYYCDRCYIFDMVQNKSLLAGCLRSTGNSRLMARELKGKGITHILMNTAIFSRWTRKTFDAQEMKILKELFKLYTKVLCSHNGYVLFRLGSYPVQSIKFNPLNCRIPRG